MKTNKGHDWSTGSEIRFCRNVGCGWVMFPRGNERDPRVHYAPSKLAMRILKPHPCNGKKEDGK